MINETKLTYAMSAVTVIGIILASVNLAHHGWPF